MAKASKRSIRVPSSRLFAASVRAGLERVFAEWQSREGNGGLVYKTSALVDPAVDHLLMSQQTGNRVLKHLGGTGFLNCPRRARVQVKTEVLDTKVRRLQCHLQNTSSDYAVEWTEGCVIAAAISLYGNSTGIFGGDCLNT